MQPTLRYLVLPFVLFLSITLFAQDTQIQDQSKPFDLSQLVFDCNQFQDPYPPHLVGQFIYNADGNDNGVLESKEDFTIKFTITNRGAGRASCIEIFATDSASEYQNRPVIDFGKVKKIAYLRPDETDTVEITLRPNMNLDSARRRITIHVNEHFKYDMQPLDLGIVSWKYEPKLKYLGYELREIYTPNSVDNALQPGEIVEVKLIIQNQSHSMAFSPRFTVKAEDPDENIYLGPQENPTGNYAHSGRLETMGSYGLDTITFRLSPTPRYRSGAKHLPIKLTLSDSLNTSHIYSENVGIELNQEPRKVETIAWKPAENQNITMKTSEAWNVDTLKVKNVIPRGYINPNAVAIVIGVENYDYIPKAPYAAKDAHLMKKYFNDVLGVTNTLVFTDKEVSGKFFDDMFNPSYGKIKRYIQKNKTDLYVFYSGHGIPSKDSKTAYLFPSDGRMERLESDGYDLNSFYNNLNTIGANSVTVFVDACFSGSGRTTSKYRDNSLTGEKGVRIVKPKIDGPWETNPNFTVFTSSDYEETSLGVDAVQTGLFTYFLAGGLKGKADTNGDMEITAYELGRYIQANVAEVSPVLYGKQTPQYMGSSLNDKIILKY